MGVADLLGWVLEAEVDLGFGHPVLWREIIGNVFGLTSAWLGMRRIVWAWPVGIIGNVVLFTVFAGVLFANPQELTLWGQAGRQVFFVAVSLYGWYRWGQFRRTHQGGTAVEPRWATARERVALLVIGLALWGLLTLVLRALDSWGPVVDAWILAGSILATYGMARGYVEFWLIWVAVDLVGVPTLVLAGFYPSAVMYVIYGLFCVLGFIQWWRIRRDRHDRSAVSPTGHRELSAPGSS